MQRVFIANAGELILKGKNRSQFEQRLKSNIELAFAGLPVRVRAEFGYFEIEPVERVTRAQEDEIKARLRTVYGLASFYSADRIENDVNAIQAHALSMMEGNGCATFAVRAKRINRGFPVSSMELEKQIGAAIARQYKLQVELSHPDCTLHIRITDHGTYLYSKAETAGGGLPVGTGGKMVTLISSGLDSPVASQMMMRRGANLVYLHFHSYPATSRGSIENVTDIVKQLQRHQPAAPLLLAPFHEFQQVIIENAPASLRVVMYRRGMFEIAEMVAKARHAKALIAGESLGQVASQTVQNMTATSSGLALPVFRPLIGMDKQEIVDRAQAIGTYDISIRDDEDCCSFLVPKRVQTFAKVEDVERIIKALAWNKMKHDVLRQIEEQVVGAPHGEM